jgi:hypothetical protein
MASNSPVAIRITWIVDHISWTRAYLGHRNIQHTVRYAELPPTHFKNLWRD